MKRRILIIGLGYLGHALAKHLQDRSYFISGTTRSKDKLHTFSTMVLWPLNSLKDYETIIFAAGADRRDDYKQTYLENAQLIMSLLDVNQHLIYTSSTSVYGDHQGQFVDEETCLKPLNTYSEILIETEQLFRQQKNHCILRLGELIGPGRTIEDRLCKIKGKTLPGEGNFFTNLSPRSDVIRAIHLAIEAPLQGVYNVCSPYHPTRKELYEHVSTQKKWNPFSWDKIQSSFHTGNKRVLSQKIQHSGFSFDKRAYEHSIFSVL